MIADFCNPIYTLSDEGSILSVHFPFSHPRGEIDGSTTILFLPLSPPFLLRPPSHLPSGMFSVPRGSPGRMENQHSFEGWETFRAFQPFSSGKHPCCRPYFSPSQFRSNGFFRVPLQRVRGFSLPGWILYLRDRQVVLPRSLRRVPPDSCAGSSVPGVTHIQ